MSKDKSTFLILFFLLASTIFVCVEPFKTSTELEEKAKQQKIAQEIAIENQRKLNEELLRAKIVKSSNFIKSVSNETQILLFTENGEHSKTHDRTPENNWYSEWLNNAELTIKVDYRTLFAIKTKDIRFNITDDGIVNVSYDSSKIFISSVDVSNVLPLEKTGICGLEYKPIEVTALENIIKEEIKVLSYNDENILSARNNLKVYLMDYAAKFE